MKKPLAAVILVVALAVPVWLHLALTMPHGGQGEAHVEIRRGETVRSVARRLAREEVIGSPLLFELEARLRGGGVRAGEYLLGRDLSVRAVVDTLVSGKIFLHRVTLREGLTAAEIAAELERAGLARAGAFLEAADRLARREPRIGAGAEGYLFPDTYLFAKDPSPETVAGTMLENFFRQTAAALPEAVINDPRELRRIVTIASIVEKETGAESERRLIASVFANRLAKNMLLQSDPTVIYALPSFDGNLRKKDLLYDSPYNTYIHRGLPPGPISNPGLASIDAVYRPAKADYYYFVSKNDGEHHFSRTLSEHNRAVTRFQLGKENDAAGSPALER